jgi:hypothetical protein
MSGFVRVLPQIFTRFPYKDTLSLLSDLLFFLLLFVQVKLLVNVRKRKKNICFLLFFTRQTLDFVRF